MAKLSYKISYYVLYVMFIAILAVLGLFFFGGDAQGDAVLMGVDPEMWQPAQTDALLYLMYGLLGIAVVATVLAFLFQFGSALKDNPVKALKSLKLATLPSSDCRVIVPFMAMMSPAL